MSFSSDVREEISQRSPGGRHCQIAELSAICDITGRLHIGGVGGKELDFTTENLSLSRKLFTLLEKSFNIQADTSIRVHQKRCKGAGRSPLYRITAREPGLGASFLEALKYNKSDAERRMLIADRNCCRRAYLCGAFLAAGSVSDPGRSYHFEIACPDEGSAVFLRDLIASLGVDEPIGARIIPRKKQHVVYVKEGSGIVELLGLMGAHRSLMDMETLRVVREMRGSINRRVNCETANINKTVSAAVRQIEDIEYIREQGGFSHLKEPLLEMALVRLEHPEAALKELGEMLQPPVGKSGVNHRLRRLSEIADELRVSRSNEAICGADCNLSTQSRTGSPGQYPGAEKESL